MTITTRVPSEPQKALLTDLNGFFQANSKFYSHVEVGLCLNLASTLQRVIAGKIALIPRIEPVRPEIDYDYGDIRLLRWNIPATGFPDLLDGVWTRDSITHATFGEIELGCEVVAYGNVRGLGYYWHESRRRWAYVNQDWPFYVFELRVPQRDTPQIRPLARKGLPLYPSWYRAAYHALGIGSQPSDPQQMHRIVMVIPDPRARIDGVTLEGRTIEIRTVAGEVPADGLLVKVFAAAGNAESNDTEAAPTGGKLTKVLPFDPDAVCVQLIAAESGDGIDGRDFEFGWANFPVDVVVRRSEESLVEFLERGETQHVEYKANITDKVAREKIPKVVASFANTEGGIIFVGVDDEGKPVASIDPKEADRISQIIAETVDPLPKLDFQTLHHGGYDLMAVVVAAGKERPYIVKDHGPYIRYNGTSRPPNRAQLLALYPTKENRGPGQP